MRKGEGTEPFTARIDKTACIRSHERHTKGNSVEINPVFIL
jgi:hypothetical protein